MQVTDRANKLSSSLSSLGGVPLSLIVLTSYGICLLCLFLLVYFRIFATDFNNLMTFL